MAIVPLQPAQVASKVHILSANVKGCCTHGMQDSGTAIWLFAYFGYWLEVIVVLAARAARGTLLSAAKKRPTTRPGALPTVKEVTAPGTPPSPDAKVPGELSFCPTPTEGLRTRVL